MASPAKGVLADVMLVACMVVAVRPVYGELSRIPSELQCQFESYVSAVAEKGVPRFTVEILQDAAGDHVTYSNIYLDEHRQTGFAWAEGRNVSDSRPILRTGDTTWVFTEFTSRGNLYVTQIFLEDEPGAGNGVFRAVRSRQYTAMGAVVATQHYGHCTAIY